MRQPIDILVGEAVVEAQQSAPAAARMATVSALGGDGTITAALADGSIPRVRVLSGCPPLLVGDVVTILATAGGWVCAGRNLTTSSAWITPTLVSPFIAYTGGGGPWQGARYRRIGREVEIQGIVGASAAHAASPTIFTLDAGYRPAAHLVFPTVRNGNVARQLTISTTGAVILQNAPAETISYVSVACRFSI